MKINSGQAPSTLVPKYIGSDFDQVVTVGKNIEDVKAVAGAVGDVGVVADNIGSVTTVATNIGDVVNVSDNMDYVKDVAAGIAGLPVISYIGEEPPTQPEVGSSWYCTTDGRTYVWYRDIDSYQWVESSPQSAPLDLQDVREVAIANTERQMKLLGYDLVKGSFEEGALLSKSTDVVLYKHTGVVYKWKGVFPTQIAANSSPTGTGISNWEEVVVPVMEASVREALRRSYAEAGYNLVDGSFEVGGTLVNANDVLLRERTGKVFSGPAGTVAARTNPASGGFVDKSGELLRNELATSDRGTIKIFGTGNSVIDTAAIRSAFARHAAENLDLYLYGEFEYDNSDGPLFIDYRATTNASVFGAANSRIWVSGTLGSNPLDNHIYTFDVASKSSKLNKWTGVRIEYRKTNYRCGGVYISRNGFNGLSQWGGCLDMESCYVGKFHTPVEMHRCYAWNFVKCVFTGADEGVYTTSSLSPAVAGKTSRCIYINGGYADGEGGSGDVGDGIQKDFSNCGKFSLCEFQGAKFGIEGYHIRQTQFDNCVFQFMWIGLSNIVDDIHGGYNLGDVQLVGSNYFEYMAHSCMSDTYVTDAGVISPISGKRRSEFYSDGSKNEFNGEQWLQLRSVNNRLIINSDSKKNTQDSLIQVNVNGQSKFKIISSGLPVSVEGYAFDETRNLGDSINSKVLDTYQRVFNGTVQPLVGSVSSPVAGSFSQYFTNIGRICFCTIGASGFTAYGSGDVTVYLPPTVLYPRAYIDARIVSHQGGSGYEGALYPITLGGGIKFRKSVSAGGFLTFADLGISASSNLQLSVTFLSYGV